LLRCTLVIALLCAVAMVGAATRVTAQQDDLIRVGAGPDDPSAPLIYAASAGLFKKAGLNVQLVKLGGGAFVATAVAGGSLEIGKGSTASVVTAVGRGLPFSVIGAIAKTSPGHRDVALVVSTSAAIAGPKDLIGKTMADVSLADQSTIATFTWLDQRGVDHRSLQYVEVPASATVAAIEQGRVVGASLYEPALSAAVATGKVRVLGYPFEAVASRWAEAVLYGNSDWLQQHADLVKRFLRVTGEASAYVGAHEDQVAPIVAQFSGIDPSTLVKVTHPGRSLAVNAGDIQPMIDALAKYKVIPKGFPASDMICPCAPHS
jgi:ABC-type nitrate/sulfonate/bicarbonate transport system substrate-binding protein